MWPAQYFCPTNQILIFITHISMKISNIQFYKYPISGSPADTCRWTDRQIWQSWQTLYASIWMQLERGTHKIILESSMCNNFKYYCSNFSLILDGISKFMIILDSVIYKTYSKQLDNTENCYTFICDWKLRNPAS
jgi:hypothetical protein